MSIDRKIITCSLCNKKISGEKVYTQRNKTMCEDCAIKEGLFPLGHTGHLKQSFFIKDRKR